MENEVIANPGPGEVSLTPEQFEAFQHGYAEWALNTLLDLERDMGQHAPNVPEYVLVVTLPYVYFGEDGRIPGYFQDIFQMAIAFDENLTEIMEGTNPDASWKVRTEEATMIHLEKALLGLEGVEGMLNFEELLDEEGEEPDA